MGEMDDKLRSMRVNMDQRKRLMAAGRFGIGPLVQMGMVEKKEYPEPLPFAALGAPGSFALDGPRQPPSRGSEQEQRKQAFRKLHADDGLEDLNAFLAPTLKRRPPASRDKTAVPVAASVTGLARPPKEGEDTTRKLVTRLAPRPPPEADPEPALSPDRVRATASTAGARPKAATFKARQGPTIEEVRKLQRRYDEKASQDKFNGAYWSRALEVAIEDLRMEEVRRARKEERRRRDEWRKTWKEEKKRKTTPSKTKQEDEEEEASGGSCSGSSGDSGDSAKRRRFKEAGLSAKQMDDEQRRFWGETVKGRVSNVNKGFTDADLEQRFKSQQAAAASENLMTESQVIALMKAKDKGKDKVKRKEKPKDALDRSRERRRRSSSK
mmetsp:Transcript_104815/g.163414  ORF Transcript_104815/g.163414 Transcript_104815/m.163414 type:complete len:382 (+) Transcript_104815:65-1210(+)